MKPTPREIHIRARAPNSASNVKTVLHVQLAYSVEDRWKRKWGPWKTAYVTHEYAYNGDSLIYISDKIVIH